MTNALEEAAIRAMWTHEIAEEIESISYVRAGEPLDRPRLMALVDELVRRCNHKFAEGRS